MDTLSRKKKITFIYFFILLIVFLIIIFSQSCWVSTLKFLFPEKEQLIYPRASISTLVWEHLKLVAFSSVLSTLTGVLIAILVTRKFGKSFLPLADNLSAIGQTFPPVAVLALSVPLLGFGFEPTVFALFIYGILPILRNTINGFQSIAKDIHDAAEGVGMTPLQKLFKVELPLAFPYIIAGIRISVIINIGTATVGATIGAGGLGAPITAGLISNNFAYLLQGALPAALMAFLFDAFFNLLED
jgi:osmoprotectant transport system permease protein